MRGDYLFAFIQKHPGQDSEQLAKHFSITRASVNARLTDLKKAGKIRRDEPRWDNVQKKRRPARWYPV